MEYWYNIGLILGAGILLLIIWLYLRNKSYRRPFYRNKAWKEFSPATHHKLQYSVFLIGDSGSPLLDRMEPAFRLLQKQLHQTREKSAVAFLGDLIYPEGLPKPDDKLRLLAEKRIQAQMNLVKYHPGEVIFIAGNHDYNKGRRDGLEHVLRLESYVGSYMNRGEVFYPSNGCPGPVEKHLTENLTMIIINTQWWLQSRKRRPLGDEWHCEAKSKEHFFELLYHMIKKNEDKEIIVVGHLPLFSYSFHGGKFPVKHHLFPLTALHKHLYIPLPVAGSLYPMYRKWVGAKEDMSHYRYKRLRKKLLKVFHKKNDLIYAAGHDHNLQYIKNRNQHYIVSGSGSKVHYVRKGRKAHFTHAHKGFFRVNYYENGSVWIEAWEPKENGEEGILAFRKRVK